MAKTATLVDSNVLLDVITQDINWYEWSSEALNHAAENGVVIINPLVYAEVSVRYERIEELDAAVPETLVRREALPWEAAFLAGKAFLAYRRKGGLRTAPLPDFYIGAHAAVRGYSLLTRDPSNYRTYYPRLRLVSPK